VQVDEVWYPADFLHYDIPVLLQKDFAGLYSLSFLILDTHPRHALALFT